MNKEVSHMLIYADGKMTRVLVARVQREWRNVEH